MPASDRVCRNGHQVSSHESRRALTVGGIFRPAVDDVQLLQESLKKFDALSAMVGRQCDARHVGSITENRVDLPVGGLPEFSRRAGVRARDRSNQVRSDCASVSERFNGGLVDVGRWNRFGRGALPDSNTSTARLRSDLPDPTTSTARIGTLSPIRALPPPRGGQAPGFERFDRATSAQPARFEHFDRLPRRRSPTFFARTFEPTQPGA